MFERGFESLTSYAFKEIPTNDINESYSQLRFLPKNSEGDLRPIVNMKRKIYKTVSYCYFF